MKKTKNTIEKTLERISAIKTPYNKSVYVILVILYIISSIIVAGVAGSRTSISIGHSSFPISAMAGILSTLANIFIMFMVVYFGKLGFFTALILLVMTFPSLISGMVASRSLAPIPGAFTNLFTIIAIIIIYINNKKLIQYQRRLYDQVLTDMLTGLPNGFASGELMNKLVNRHERFAAVSADINNFKSINDTMGHSTGNKILKEIAV
ncbi:MAG: diguanylate cyclase, partial [Oscillospiraceae bacterium]|nr:diguanylate cyclase [Oscillospiraceae bacterium]